MQTDYTAALRARTNLIDRFMPGTELRLPSGRVFTFLGVALHSETLAPYIVMTEAATGTRHAARPGAVRETGRIGNVPRLAGDTWRHRKGSLYTRLGKVAMTDEAFTLYVAHSDLVWWLRPNAMFDDGRFTREAQTAPLGEDALGA